jgi:NADPH:quinone reductase
MKKISLTTRISGRVLRIYMVRLVVSGNFQAGETVLIVVVVGADSHTATQIVCWKKTRVLGADINSGNPSQADAIINTSNLPKEVRLLTSGKGGDLVPDTAGSPMFERSLKSPRYGGPQIVSSSTLDKRVSFDLAGLDTIKLTDIETADLMNELRVSFQEGNLQTSAISAWFFEHAIEAYEAAENDRKSSRRTLILDTVG